MIERELKLSVPPRFRPPDLDGVVEGVTAARLDPLSLRATYYDTRDLRLIRWGITMRYRTGEGWTVKLPGDSSSELMSRHELHFDGGPRRLPVDALELLRAHTRRTPLEVVARMRTVRRPVELRDESGERVAEVEDDEVSVFDGRRVAERFRELEIELADGFDGDALLAATLERMQSQGATTAPPTPKLVRAVGPMALEPPEVHAADVDESSAAGDVVARAIARSVARFLRHDPGVVLGDDPEDVHQARVALRRLRSDLRTFGPLLDEEWNAHLRSEARWLGGLLGEVRDADVLHDALMREADALPYQDAAALRAMLVQLETARSEARTRLLAARRGDRFLDLCEEMVSAAQSPAFTELAAEPAIDVLPALVVRPWRRLRRAGRALDQQSPDDALHDLRIRTKRVRYAAEAIAPATGKRARRIAKAAARLQDVLGAHQDATIAQEWLRRAAASGASAGEAFAAGQAFARQARVAELTRRRWPRVWRRLERRADRGWLRRARRAERAERAAAAAAAAGSNGAASAEPVYTEAPGPGASTAAITEADLTLPVHDAEEPEPPAEPEGPEDLPPS